MRRIQTIERKIEAKFAARDAAWWKTYVTSDPERNAVWETICEYCQAHKEDLQAAEQRGEFLAPEENVLGAFERLGWLENRDDEFRKLAGDFIDWASQSGWPMLCRLITEGWLVEREDAGRESI